MATFSRVSAERVQFTQKLSAREIDTLIADTGLKVLQCSMPISPKKWALLNDRFFSQRPDVQLRVYQHPYDLSFVAEMSNVRNFTADCMIDAEGVENVGCLENLEYLSIGIWELESLEFLNEVPRNLKGLSLGWTKSKKPDLTPLSRFESLVKIYIEGHRKNIEVLSELTTLADVTLRSISTPDISYLRPLKRMWSLDMKLGGIKSLYAIAGMENIKYLELWQIKGLSDIGVISSLVGLQHLYLQSLPRVRCLPQMTRLKKLRRIYLENMKGLEDLHNLEYAPALEEFIHVSAQNMQLEDYQPLLRNRNLKRAWAGLGSWKKNKRFEELLDEFNIEHHEFHPFEFE